LHDNLQNQLVPQPWPAELSQTVLRPRGRDKGKPHADFLNIPDVRSNPDTVKEGKWLIKLEAEQTMVPTYPDCSCPIREVKPHSPFTMQGINDLPWGRKSVIFSLKRRRWKCKSCSKTAAQPADFLAVGRYHMTKRLLEYLEVHSLFETELSLAKETGVFERTIREIRDEFVERLKREIKFDTPRVLGMDGVRADSKRRRVILTDIEAGFVLDLMESGSKASIAKRILEFPAWEDIQVVTIDMCRTLCAAVKEALPHAIIIIDLFHIMRIANQVMDAVRNRLFPRVKKKREPGQLERPRPEPFRKRRASLTERDLSYMEYWYKQKPELRLAYDLKEDYLEIFDEEYYASGMRTRTKAAARHFYEEWLGNFPLEGKYPDLHKDFKKLFSAMKNWGEFIFNYFDHKYTNAFTESMNRKVKDILRNARGCKFETMHARIVYGTYLMKKRDLDREAERKERFPRSRKRRSQQQPAATRKDAAKVNGRRIGRCDGYEFPDFIQTAFNFTN
jgi:transposase